MNDGFGLIGSVVEHRDDDPFKNPFFSGLFMDFLIRDDLFFAQSSLSDILLSKYIFYSFFISLEEIFLLLKVKSL